MALKWNLIGIVWVLGIPLLCKGIPQANIGYDFGDPRMEDLLDRCLDSRDQKSKPGPEDSLHNQVRS